MVNGDLDDESKVQNCQWTTQTQRIIFGGLALALNLRAQISEF
jgi:hypothetical protein